jgi:hypothetical protein
MAMLRAAVTHLAAPADEQQAYLNSIGTGWSADELALEFDDVFEAALALDTLSPDAEAAVHQLDQQLSAMSGQEHSQLWMPAALEHEQAWATVRTLARRALDLI